MMSWNWFRQTSCQSRVSSSRGYSARPRPSGSRALPPGGLDLKNHLSTIESKLIREAMEKSHGVVADAARLLGMRRTTLVEKMRKSELSLAATPFSSDRQRILEQ